MTNSVLRYSASREASAAAGMARVAASQRVRAERERREAQAAARARRLQETGQYDDGQDVFCFICSRATDHLGEHTEEQIRAWQQRA